MAEGKPQKIKITRIITRLNIGGPSIHAVLLSEGLDKDAFETRLVAGSPDPSEGDMSYLAGQKGVEVTYVPELSREPGFKDIKAFFRILKILMKDKPDIVHTHMAKAGSLGRMAAVFAGVPVKIHTFHGHVLDGYFSPLKERIFLFIERFLALFTDRIITISDSVRSEIVDRLKISSGDKCVVIKLGFDLDRFLGSGRESGVFRKKIGADSARILVGIVGRLVPVKNHRMFLDAAKIVIERKDCPDIMFVVVGDGQLKAELSEYARSIGIDNLVKFTGWAEDVASVYADLDIVALTSLNEGTPVSLIEAMASSRPVVATDVGGVRDVVSDGKDGFLAEKGNAADFSQKLYRLIKDEGMRLRFGAAGREKVRKIYLRDRLLADISGLYTDMMRRKKIGPVKEPLLYNIR